jgi:hypothetical protein
MLRARYEIKNVKGAKMYADCAYRRTSVDKLCPMVPNR